MYLINRGKTRQEYWDAAVAEYQAKQVEMAVAGEETKNDAPPPADTSSKKAKASSNSKAIAEAATDEPVVGDPNQGTIEVAFWHDCTVSPSRHQS